MIKLTPSLSKVNSWTEQKDQKTPVRAIQTLGKKVRKNIPHAMCLGTSCMDNQCGWNCGVVEDRFMRLKKNLTKSVQKTRKQRAA